MNPPSQWEQQLPYQSKRRAPLKYPFLSKDKRVNMHSLLFCWTDWDRSQNLLYILTPLNSTSLAWDIAKFEVICSKIFLQMKIWFIRHSFQNHSFTQVSIKVAKSYPWLNQIIKRQFSCMTAKGLPTAVLPFSNHRDAVGKILAMITNSACQSSSAYLATTTKWNFNWSLWGVSHLGQA